MEGREEESYLRELARVKVWQAVFHGLGQKYAKQKIVESPHHLLARSTM